MAHRLQKVTAGKHFEGWLIVAALLMPAPAFGAFSHRVHLANKIDCNVCHSDAATSVKASDNLIPKPEVCLGCHKDPPVTNKEPRRTNVSRFNHQRHARMGSIAPVILRAIDNKKYLSDPAHIHEQLSRAKNTCSACHRGLETSDEVTPAAFPAMADCLVCHNNIDPPFTCTKCHEQGAELKPASHVPGFLDRHSSGKLNLDKTTCAVCHGRQFTCLGCH
ncbi:MAG: hypothetical protein H7Y20_16020 [Bryobacteraceae bacterium]|nr:hypothetical protein [Bryobacteraceae bacterium]